LSQAELNIYFYSGAYIIYLTSLFVHTQYSITSLKTHQIYLYNSIAYTTWRPTTAHQPS